MQHSAAAFILCGMETTAPETGYDGRARAARRRARRWVLVGVAAGIVAVAGLLALGLQAHSGAGAGGCQGCPPSPQPSDLLSTVVPAVTAIVGVVLTAVSTVIAVLTYRMARAVQAKTAAPSSPPPRG